MKKIFTFVIALLSMFATTQLASAATGVFNVTVPTGTNQCWIMGNFAGTAVWPVTAAIQCTKVDATHYTVTLDDATFLEGITMATLQYKYLSGTGDWAYVEKDATGAEISNRTYLGTSPQVDVVVNWASIFTPHVPQPMNVTIDVLVPAGTVQCYIVGNFNSWAGPTAPVDSCKMVLTTTNDDGTMVFEKTVYTADAVLLAYHFCSGPDWSFEQLDPTGDYHYPQVNPVVNSWKLIYDPSKLGDINVTATVPAGTTDVWVNGSFIGWNFNNGAGGLKCTKNADGTFSFTAPLVMNIEYKLYNGQTWNNVEVDDMGVEVANRKAAFPADANTNITVIGWKTPSALQELNANKYKVYTYNNSIVVEGVTSQVTIFDVSGRKIQSAKLAGKFSSKALNSGLYILLVDGATKKVAVN